MCECCGGDCKLTGGYYEFSEAITKVEVSELVMKNECTIESLIINGKWRMLATEDSKNPFRIEEI